MRSNRDPYLGFHLCVVHLPLHGLPHLGWSHIGDSMGGDTRRSELGPDWLPTGNTYHSRLILVLDQGLLK